MSDKLYRRIPAAEAWPAFDKLDLIGCATLIPAVIEPPKI